MDGTVQLETLAAELASVRRRCVAALGAAAACAAICLATAAYTFRGDQSPSPEIHAGVGGLLNDRGDIVGRSLSLRDTEGRVWLRAVPTPTGGELWVRSSAGTGVQLRADESQMYICITGVALGQQVMLGVAKKIPHFTMRRADLSTSVMIGENVRFGHGLAVFLDENENPKDWIPASTPLPGATAKDGRD